MKKREDPEDLKVAISFLRVFRGWNQTELARAAGMDKSLISLYELGRKKPSPKTVERLLKATGVPSFLFEDVLRMIHMVRVAAADLDVESTTIAEDLAWAVAASLKIALIELLGDLEDLDEKELAKEPEKERAEAEELWSTLQPFSPQDRRLLVKEGREFKSWALVERICQECEEVAPNDPIQAQEIAELALMVAALVPGNDRWRSRLQGYAWAFMGDARRTAGDVAGAEEAFQRARHLWHHTDGPESFALLDEDVFLRLQPSN
ncbi:MAG TPA: helix-turn-helix domain-containing protein [Thermoanaerobaculia bacterium]